MYSYYKNNAVHTECGNMYYLKLIKDEETQEDGLIYY